jgi:TolB protein
MAGRDLGAIVQMDTRGHGWKVIRGDVEGAWEPVFSRDGSQLAFISGEFRELWIAAADGTRARRILRIRGQASLSAPTWSPDGRRIAYSGASPMGASDRRVGLWIIDVATRRGRLVTPTRLDDPDWSPDGRWFAHAVGAPADKIGVWLLSSDGRRKRRLTTGLVTSPRWSPGGRWIANQAWAETSTGSDEVRIIDPATGRLRTVASPGWSPLAWSPDGVWLAYTTDYAVKQTYDEVFRVIRIRRIRDGVRRVVIATRMTDLYGLSWRRP